MPKGYREKKCFLRIELLQCTSHNERYLFESVCFEQYFRTTMIGYGMKRHATERVEKERPSDTKPPLGKALQMFKQFISHLVMKLLIPRPVPPSQSWAGIIFPLILVFGGVSSLCIEDDCSSQSIKVIDAKTGECLSCFPCLECPVGVPSVPCGATVPDGTDIHCAALGPHPALVSRASATTINGIFTSLATSSSISFWHSSLTTTEEIISSPVAISPHSAVVRVSSSKPIPVYKSSTVNLDSEKTGEPRKREELAIDEDNEIIEYLILASISAAAMFWVMVAIVHGYQKWKATRSSNSRVQAAETTYSNRPLQQERHSDACTIDLATESVAFLRAHPRDDQDSQRENDNEQVQPDQTHMQSCDAEAVVIPPSLDVSNVGAKVSKSHSLFAPPDLMWFDTGSRLAGALDQIRSPPWSALSQTDKYNTKMEKVPFLLRNKICLKLDVERTSGNDVRQFADKLGISEEFECLHQDAVIKRTTTTSIILKEKFAGTVGDFIAIMKAMGRDDIIQSIETWKE